MEREARSLLGASALPYSRLCYRILCCGKLAMQASALSSAASASLHAMASPQGHGRSSRYARWAQAWGSARHAYLLTALGRLDDASKELRQALASAPDSPERAMWMTDLGHLSALLGKHDNHYAWLFSVALLRPWWMWRTTVYMCADKAMATCLVLSGTGRFTEARDAFAMAQRSTSHPSTGERPSRSTLYRQLHPAVTGLDAVKQVGCHTIVT
jgi:tetratricopeptide (TPR) repeat protein